MDNEKVDSDKSMKTGSDLTTWSNTTVERLRSTAQWLVVSFTGVAGVLLAGLSLSGLGSIDQSMVWPALIAVFVTLASVSGIIYWIARVLYVGSVSRDMFYVVQQRYRARLSDGLTLSDPTFNEIYNLDDPGLYEGRYTSLDEFLEGYKSFSQSLWKPSTIPLAYFSGEAAYFHRTMEQLKAVVRVSIVSYSFRTSLKWVVGLAILAGCGIAAYAYTLSHKQPQLQSKFLLPSEGIVSFTESGIKRYKGLLGAQCPMVELPGWILEIGDSATEPRYRVLIYGNPNCKQAEYMFRSEDVLIAPKGHLIQPIK